MWANKSHLWDVVQSTDHQVSDLWFRDREVYAEAVTVLSSIRDSQHGVSER